MLNKATVLKNLNDLVDSLLKQLDSFSVDLKEELMAQEDGVTKVEVYRRSMDSLSQLVKATHQLLEQMPDEGDKVDFSSMSNEDLMRLIGRGQNEAN
jgi:hypothetical protein